MTQSIFHRSFWPLFSQFTFLTALFAAFLLAGMPVSSIAQTFNSGLRGTITDSNGAALPGAKVTLTDEATHQIRTVITDNIGAYAFSELRPSAYTLHIDDAGFSATDRIHILLATQDFLTLDVPLTVGKATDVVQVNAEAALVDPSTASVSTDLSQQQLVNLPILGRNPYMTVKVSGLFVNTGSPQFVRFADQNGTTQTSVAGGPIGSNQYLIDGVPITDTNNRPIAIPTIEAIQDVKVQANTYDAQVGRTGGAVFNTLLRSGSNVYHGSVFGATRQTEWLANDFFANRSGIPRPDSPYYNWGASLGGFVFVPHVYDGHNKTFFFIASEGYIQTSPYTESFAVPTAQERTGDFSSSHNTDGSLNVIYDPTKTYTDTAGVIHRTPFEGNIIPQNRLSNVGKNIASYYPLPQLAAPTGQTNFTGTDNVRDHAQEVTVKLDQQIRPWWNISGSYIFYEALQPLGNPLGTLPGSYSYTYHRQVDATQLNSTWILNPKTVFTARYGNNRFPNLIAEVSEGFNPSSLGFPTSLTSQFQANFFPTIFLRNFSQLGQDTSSLDNWKSQTLSGTLTRSEGKHNLSFGAEYRRIRMNFIDLGDAPGTYTFSGAFTQAFPGVSGDGSGSDMADLLLGHPVSGKVETSTQLNTYLDYFGIFAQDDLRLTRKLTLNLGLRYESETGLKEDHNQLAVGFDPTATTSLAPNTKVTGGVLFAGVNGNPRDIGDLSRLKFAPRLGASYALDSKTVLRGGYGILYAPIRYDPSAALAPGYTQYTPYVASNDNDQTPANVLDNPFPSGIEKPAGNSAGLLTGIGSSVTTYDQHFRAPRVQQFSAGIERELPGGIALEVDYIGSRSTNLSPGSTGATPINYNQLNPSNFGLGYAALSNSVANPYFGNGGTGIIGSATVAQSQLLLPYPQFSSVNLLDSSSHADYNALLVKAERRVGRGLNLISSFTWSRNRDASFATTNSIQAPAASAPQNIYDLKAEYGLAVNNVPYRFSAGVTYDLPVGHGQRFSTGSSIADLIVGNWQLNVVPTFQAGFPVTISQSSNPNSSIVGNGVQRPNLNPGISLGTHGSVYGRLGGYINPTAFSTSSVLTFGNAPRTLSLRGPGFENWDLALFKNVLIHDRFNVQFRAESFNAFNTPQFSGPNTSFGSSNFGAITSQANFPRYLQLGLRVGF
ncbi:carboxypeptidase regulatory-like domain-containing protein [Acidicapsa ligni]|uniref:carboxypeptidase regulatory-like domain-containing protein n=1 Tax=Acidicapsa ligni TaxID=542300 RepID=UPI0021E0C2A8|nr:TonB-dependent receptor [Acidicapsa ligni]